jgi:hypothetical protein
METRLTREQQEMIPRMAGKQQDMKLRMMTKQHEMELTSAKSQQKPNPRRMLNRKILYHVPLARGFTMMTTSLTFGGGNVLSANGGFMIFVILHAFHLAYALNIIRVGDVAAVSQI